MKNDVEQLDERREFLQNVCREKGYKRLPIEDERFYFIRATRYGRYRRRLYEYLECKDLKKPELNQLAVAIYKLAGDAKHSFVYSVISVLDPLKENVDLIADGRIGNIGGFPCLTTLDFKLTNDALNLCALWRHQYFDIKAYGNWISLAILLKVVCDLGNDLRGDYARVKIKPGKITSIACRADFKSALYVQKVYSLIK